MYRKPKLFLKTFPWSSCVFFFHTQKWKWQSMGRSRRENKVFFPIPISFSFSSFSGLHIRFELRGQRKYIFFVFEERLKKLVIGITFGNDSNICTCFLLSSRIKFKWWDFFFRMKTIWIFRLKFRSKRNEMFSIIVAMREFQLKEISFSFFFFFFGRCSKRERRRRVRKKQKSISIGKSIETNGWTIFYFFILVLSWVGLGCKNFSQNIIFNSHRKNWNWNWMFPKFELHILSYWHKMALWWWWFIFNQLSLPYFLLFYEFDLNFVFGANFKAYQFDLLFWERRRFVFILFALADQKEMQKQIRKWNWW